MHPVRTYDASLRQVAATSAQVIVPLVTDLITPRSVLDVGCMDGTWLATYHRAGVIDSCGVDGNHVREFLRIPTDRFVACDLTCPFDLRRRFDLVQSLAIGEHLPASAAGEFVRSLVRHGDAVLFSAAIPHQGKEHVNEQWPDYWAELFHKSGFAVYDWVRPRVWGDDRVAWWYAQNCLLFVRRGITADWVNRLPRPAPVGPLLRMVHPRQFLNAVNHDRADHQRVPDRQSFFARLPAAQSVRPYDVAVVIPTVGRPTLERAVRSVYSQEFPGTIQILIGVDGWDGDRGWFKNLAAQAPGNCTVVEFDPGYSTAARRGGFVVGGTGGALRTILSYAAHSRLVAYLDDDNWWAPDHISTLTRAVAGHDWAYSLRWYADPQTAAPLAVDRWESVGPNAGVYAARFGGFVDPSCLLIDKVACEPAMRLWCHPLPGDATGMSTDRSVFAYLNNQKRGTGTGRATAYYTLNPTDVNHRVRLRLIASVGATDRGQERVERVQANNSTIPTQLYTLGDGTEQLPAGEFTQDWFSHNLPVWERLLAPLAGQPIHALEIGVFEGRSAVWLLERVLTHPAATLTWIDTFEGSAELASLDLSGVEARFRNNVSRFGAKVTGHVGRSCEVLRGLSGEQFDLIYVDGSHEAPDVLADAVLAWPLLRSGGLLGFDDYLWQKFLEPERCPGVAIDGFLAVMRGRYRLLHRGYQVWIQKLS